MPPTARMPESVPLERVELSKHGGCNFQRAAMHLGMNFQVKNTFIEFNGDEGHLHGNGRALERSRSQPIHSPISASVPSSVGSGSSRSATPGSAPSESCSSASSTVFDLPHGAPQFTDQWSDSTDPTSETSLGESDTTRQSKEAADAEALAYAAKLHELGTCQPCLYARSKSGCLNGAACRFCHFPHTKKSRPRPCKAKRQQCKQIVGYIQSSFAEDSPEYQDVSARLSAESSYMRSLLGRPQHTQHTQQPYLEDRHQNDLTTKWLRHIGAHLSENVDTGGKIGRNKAATPGKLSL